MFIVTSSPFTRPNTAPFLRDILATSQRQRQDTTILLHRTTNHFCAKFTISSPARWNDAIAT